MSEANLVVIGSLNMDLVVRARRLPVPGETILADRLQTLPGGKGANQAVAAARLGARVAMVGRVGDDDHGRQLLRALSADGVDIRRVKVDDEAPTGTAFVVVDESGRNMIVVAPGANARVSTADVEAAAEAIAPGGVVLLQLEIPIDSVARAADLARRRGATTILNPAPAQPISDRMLSLTDVLVANEHEAALLAGRTVRSPLEAQEAALSLQWRGPRVVVVTLGAASALVAEGGATTLLPPFPVDVVDTTAAGDAFVAGMGVALAEGRACLEASRWGNAAGALACTRLGAQVSLPGRRDLIALAAIPHETSVE